ncbi:hypothetical protein ACFQ46_11150 [Kineococcus sp. GCM10028916]|uniref:hypothetical protein n=1 Tax=Kineococcus sp. GCM10028916 TaxID=3273394 RepID=UPI00363737B5
MAVNREPRSGDEALALATAALRAHTETGWVAVRAAVLDRVRRAFRPADPVVGAHELGEFVLSGDVLVTQLRPAVDAVTGVSALAISCATDDEHHLETVVVDVSAGYGVHLPSLGREVRGAVLQRLRTVLGDAAPRADQVLVDVHVADVSRALSRGSER